MRGARQTGRSWTTGPSRAARAVVGVAMGAMAAAGAIGLIGCTVGSGSGSAKGSLWVTGCNGDTNFGGAGVVAGVPQPYDLQPTFFAGEPIEDLATGSTHRNRLIIRMQGTGLATQYNDTLYFDIENSYEVARCVRGSTMGGTQDWKTMEPLYNNQSSILWCDWSGHAFTDGGAGDGGINPGSPDAGASLDGGMSVMAQYPRIRITPDTDLRSSLALLSSCPAANVSADASETPPVPPSPTPADVSWIEFQNFGSAEQSTLTADMRSPVESTFVINYGERLHANFHVVLQDAQVITAVETNQPAPAPLVGGTLDGYFDFDLERGRAAQAFP
jgi:hypothetical protein